jgi:hypothetical protein
MRRSFKENGHGGMFHRKVQVRMLILQGLLELVYKMANKKRANVIILLLQGGSGKMLLQEKSCLFL